jgi:predicted dithiol-disulfide oxidoreductase (DUF899 family)
MSMQRDSTLSTRIFVAISRAPLPQIEAVRRRMAGLFRGSRRMGATFNYDFGVSFTDEQNANRPIGYNYGTTD